MATYILLMTLTPEGRERALENPESVLSAAAAIKVPDVRLLGLYAVLGPYDFAGIMEAPDNEAAGRFSLRLGAKAGVQIVTLPTIPVMRLEGSLPGDVSGNDANIAQPLRPDNAPS